MSKFLTIFLLVVIYVTKVQAQAPEKVYGGLVIGISFKEHDNIVNSLIKSKDINIRHNEKNSTLYTMEMVDGKPVYMHLMVSATSGRVTDRMLLIASPVLEDEIYIRNMSHMRDDELIDHINIRRYILNKLSAKYGKNFTNNSTIVRFKNGVSANLESQTWQKGNLLIELYYYTIGAAHKVAVSYTMREITKENKF